MSASIDQRLATCFTAFVMTKNLLLKLEYKNYRSIFLKSAAFICVARKSFQTLRPGTNPPPNAGHSFKHTAISESN